MLTIKDDLLNDYGFYKNELADSVKYSCLKENKFSFRTPIKIYRFIRRVNPDIVHIHLAGALNVVALFYYFLIENLCMYKRCMDVEINNITIR